MCQLHPGGLLHAEISQQEVKAVTAVREAAGPPSVGVMVEGSLTDRVLHMAEVDVGPLEDLRQEFGMVEEVEPVTGLLLSCQKLSPGKKSRYTVHCWKTKLFSTCVTQCINVRAN